jgi:hypothetical protein
MIFFEFGRRLLLGVRWWGELPTRRRSFRGLVSVGCARPLKCFSKN